jgi:hypothetical protein
LARANGFAIDVNCASTAQGSATTEFGAGHAKFITDNPKQRRVSLGVGRNGFTVNFELKTHRNFLD